MRCKHPPEKRSLHPAGGGYPVCKCGVRGTALELALLGEQPKTGPIADPQVAAR